MVTHELGNSLSFNQSMEHRADFPPGRVTKIHQLTKGKKRKRKEKFSPVNTNTMSAAGSTQKTASSTAASVNGKDCSFVSKPSKRRRMKKAKPASKENSENKFKPVLVVKKPEDYSANWKLLKETITEGDKKKKELSKPIKHHEDVGNKSVKNKETFQYRRSNHEKKYADSAQVNVKNQGTAKKKKEKLEIWFDNVDPILLDRDEEDSDIESNRRHGRNRKAKIDKSGNTSSLVKEKSFDGTTKTVAMDCEMVGVGMNGKDSILARVSIVNHYGKVLYDKYVKPTEEVVDYRTAVSGIRPRDLEKGIEFSTVQKEVADLIAGHVLVGHAVHNDLRTLFLCHPRSLIRDTSRYKGFVRAFGGRTPSLKKLTERFVGVHIQQGEHSSVQDAQAAMRLYTMHRREWEKSRAKKYYSAKTKKNIVASDTLPNPASQETKGD